MFESRREGILTDFGISRIFGERLKTDVDATKTMVSKTGRGKLVLGTEHYIALEVEHGEEAVITAAQNYGPIPNKKYTWLMNGNADAPQIAAQLIADAVRSGTIGSV